MALEYAVSLTIWKQLCSKLRERKERNRMQVERTTIVEVFLYKFDKTFVCMQEKSFREPGRCNDESVPKGPLVQGTHVASCVTLSVTRASSKYSHGITSRFFVQSMQV